MNVLEELSEHARLADNAIQTVRQNMYNEERGVQMKLPPSKEALSNAHRLILRMSDLVNTYVDKPQ